MTSLPFPEGLRRFRLLFASSSAKEIRCSLQARLFARFPSAGAERFRKSRVGYREFSAIFENGASRGDEGYFWDTSVFREPLCSNIERMWIGLAHRYTTSFINHWMLKMDTNKCKYNRACIYFISFKSWYSFNLWRNVRRSSLCKMRVIYVCTYDNCEMRLKFYQLGLIFI